MLKHFLPLLFASFGFYLNAQSIRAKVQDAPYIHFDNNVLHFPGGSSLSDKFFEKMKDLMLFGEGKIQVLHIGGSHIQADIYSNRMRNHLSNFLPNLMSSRGLIFPYSVAKTNNPKNFKVTYNGQWSSVRNVNKILDNPLGLSGISVATRDTNANIQIMFNVPKETTHEFNRLKVLHNTDSFSFDLRWMTQDSVTILRKNGYTEFIFDQYHNDIQLGLKQKDSLKNRFELLGLVLESDRPGFVYSSVGVNGASTWSYLKCEKFQDHLNIVSPDLVFFGIGINDAHDANFSAQSYYSNYEKLITQFKAVNPSVLLIFITNNDSYGSNGKPNINAELVRQVMFDLAKKYQGAVWDLYNVMGGLASCNTWRDAGLMAKDRVHFSGEGYNIIGDLLFNAFMESFEDYLIKQVKN